jgi:two-component system chemotaxis response regulator CheB
MLRELLAGREGRGPVRVLCAACSTGEEVYSLALFLESKRLANVITDYTIVGFDIDPVSVGKAKRAIYSAKTLNDIPLQFRRSVLVGSGKTEGLFTFDKEIRARVKLFDADLRHLGTALQARSEPPFDVVMCRNVLIYFDDAGVAKAVKTLAAALSPGGLLILGHSEAIDAGRHGFEPRGRSLYRTRLARREAAPAATSGGGGAGRVLVVDDSAVIRRVMMSLLAETGFEVDAVESAAAATRYLSEKSVDLVTLDLNMPELDGATWLRQQRAQGFRAPVVIVSDAAPAEAEDVLGALTKGAQDYIEKRELRDNAHQLGERLKAIAAHARSATAKAPLATVRDASIRRFRPDLILIGSSTGGTEALVSMLSMMPPTCPPLVVVQHITLSFAPAFAARLARATGLPLGTMKQDETLQDGRLYMATGDYHIGVKRAGGLLKLDISHSEAEHSVRPAVDVLFRSAAKTRAKIVAAILTGMGKDGALGMLDLKHAGALTMAQDEASCVVFGMPREAIQVGAVRLTADLRGLRNELDQCLAVTAATTAA